MKISQTVLGNIYYKSLHASQTIYMYLSLSAMKSANFISFTDFMYKQTV